MFIHKVLLTVVATFTVTINMYSASADGGLAFPPAHPMNNHKFPPNSPAVPQLKNAPVNTNTSYSNTSQYSTQQRQYMVPAPIQVQAYKNIPKQYVMPNTVNRQAYNPGNNFKNNTGNFPFSNTYMMPFGSNNGNNFFPFSKGNSPFSGVNGGMVPSNPMNTMFGNNNQNFNMPFMTTNNNRKKAWGTKRNIWPDFYTDFTDESWDTMMSSPRKMGRMPGGWRFPYISTPDPVTVSDAIVNQFPPIAEEAANMADFSDWGVFD